MPFRHCRCSPALAFAGSHFAVVLLFIQVFAAYIAGIFIPPVLNSFIRLYSFSAAICIAFHNYFNYYAFIQASFRCQPPIHLHFGPAGWHFMRYGRSAGVNGVGHWAGRFVPAGRRYFALPAAALPPASPLPGSRTLLPGRFGLTGVSRIAFRSPAFGRSPPTAAGTSCFVHRAGRPGSSATNLPPFQAPACRSTVRSAFASPFGPAPRSIPQSLPASTRRSRTAPLQPSRFPAAPARPDSHHAVCSAFQFHRLPAHHRAPQSAPGLLRPAPVRSLIPPGPPRRDRCRYATIIQPGLLRRLASPPGSVRHFRPFRFPAPLPPGRVPIFDSAAFAIPIHAGFTSLGVRAFRYSPPGQPRSAQATRAFAGPALASGAHFSPARDGAGCSGRLRRGFRHRQSIVYSAAHFRPLSSHHQANSHYFPA